jgi:solute carrier family 35 protein F5
MHGDYAKGLFYILCIVVIWTFSSVLVQHVFLDLDFDGPFILTYVCSTLFSVYLLVHCANKSAYGSQLTGPEYAALPTPNLSSAEADEVIPGFSFNQTLYACLSVMPIWFVANWSYNMSLEYTSVTSNTVISNTSSLFTFFFSILILGERWSWRKFGCLMVCFIGAVVVSYADSASSKGSSTLWGDGLCLIAAVGYGLYSTVLQRMIPNEKSCDMTLFFGLMGVSSAVLAAPVGAFILLTGREKLEQLTQDVALCIVAKGLFQNVIADYLWAQAILLTSPTVTTAGLSLTIPAAIASDLMLHGIQPTWLHILGASMVLAGFLCFTSLDDGIRDDAVAAKRAAGNTKGIQTAPFITANQVWLFCGIFLLSLILVISFREHVWENGEENVTLQRDRLKEKGLHATLSFNLLKTERLTAVLQHKTLELKRLKMLLMQKGG